MLSRFVVSQVKHNSYFLVGLVLGLWLALAGVPLGDDPACEPPGAPTSASRAAPDEFEPVREERPLRPAAAPARALQRPRYYSTELGIRAPLLAAALSSEDALESRAAAINRTASRLQPALRFFITARGPQAAPGLPNVVGFTDTREMLKPFHALKYLADNYLEEYDFFFLVSDTSFVNARRLTELVSKLSVSQDVYMGSVAEDDSHYCSLEGGILVSNSVLRAVHGELDWCVRNSYSPRHHENLGRCVLHAAHVPCMPTLQGEQYVSLRVNSGEGEGGGEGGEVAWSEALTPALAAAVTSHPLHDPAHFYMLHAYVSRVYLEQDAAETVLSRGYLWRNARRHPPGYRNASWPAGLRTDPGLAPPLPDTRFDHLRWTRFNASHALMPDEHRALAPLSAAHELAVQLVTRAAAAWAVRRWGGREAALLEGSWRWEPARALRYRLLLRLAPLQRAGKHAVRLVEVVRPLGAARLVQVPYVTESERVWVLVRAVTPGQASGAPALLQHLQHTALGTSSNVKLVVVIGQCEEKGSEAAAQLQSVRDTVRTLTDKYRTQVQAVESPCSGGSEERQGEGEGEPGLGAGLRAVPRDALVLLLAGHVEFNDDFLNRVRMNTIAGWQWYLPVGFARYSLYSHPLFLDAQGRRPQVNTGRFNPHHLDVLSFYRSDYDEALSSSAAAGEAHTVRARAAHILAASPLRCIHAPDPALVRAPRPGPIPATPQDPLDRRGDTFAELDLGAKHSLARLLLETQASAA